MATIRLDEAAAARRPFYRILYVQVLIGIFIGILVGQLWPAVGVDMKPLGDGFIKLIRMLITLIVFCTVVSGIAGMSDMRKVGRVGAKALLYFEVVSTLVWAQDRILRFSCADIGVAIAVEGGLLTPVIRAADSKSLEELSRQVKDFAARTRLHKLKPHELQGGASSISNLGMFGVREFSAIINPPQSTIVAVGATQRRAIEMDDGGVGFASLMTVTLL